MDTSKTYIKMCKKAQEIQDVWCPEPYDVAKENKWLGDFYMQQAVDNWGDESHYYWVVEVYFAQHVNKNSGVVWLPRQDQLQEMVKTRHITRLVEALGKFTINCESCWQGNITISMEQLWLAFVMKEKYNKTWNGEDWVNDTRH